MIDSSGALLHASYAFMPNKLGFCGPDDRGRILEHLRESSVDDRLISTLKNFEAAYPFVHLIGSATGREPFDPKVAEAYWLGNELLEQVSPEQFYHFTTGGLKKKNRDDNRNLFLSLGNRALPHHTFYVLNTAMSVISDFHHSSAADPRRVVETLDNCRISWGKVVKVEKDSLLVRYRPIVLENGILQYAQPALKKLQYDREMPFCSHPRPGATVSMHWNFACQVLSATQVKNIRSYTERDLAATNFFLSTTKKY